MIRRPPVSTPTEHSFPPRRSSYLRDGQLSARAAGGGDGDLRHGRGGRPGAGADPRRLPVGDVQLALGVLHDRAVRPGGAGRSSEEHKSEIQSLMRISYAVFCLIIKINTPTNTKPTEHSIYL